MQNALFPRWFPGIGAAFTLVNAITLFSIFYWINTDVHGEQDQMRISELYESFEVPLVWYHSTEADPVKVARDFANNNIDPTGSVKRGEEQYWFSDSWDASRYYGENTVVARLHFRNPLLVSYDDFVNNKPHGPTWWARKARAEGHDAVVIHDICDGDMFSTVCAVFDPRIIEARPYSRWNEETQDFDLL